MKFGNVFFNVGNMSGILIVLNMCGILGCEIGRGLGFSLAVFLVRVGILLGLSCILFLGAGVLRCR